jgi:hypothetical protein
MLIIHRQHPQRPRQLQSTRNSIDSINSCLNARYNYHETNKQSLNT